MIKYRTNINCEIKPIKDTEILVENDGRLKILECEPAVLDEFLNYTAFARERAEILSHYDGRYTPDEVGTFLKTLCNEGLIDEISYEDFNFPNVAIIGEGRIFNYLVTRKDEFSNRFETMSTWHFLEKGINENIDTAIFAPGQADYRVFKKVNNKFINGKKSFIPLYYTGESYVCGPYIFPWKTPCLECVFTHHVNALNRSCTDPITLQDLENMLLSREVPFDVEWKQLEFIVELLIRDVVNSQKDENFTFYKKELHFSTNIKKGYSERIYQPITDCACCHGMNKNFSFFSRGLEVPKIPNLISGEPIKYHVGGLRSKTEEETKELLESAINNLGVSLSINLVENNIFRDVLPVYDAELKTSHKNGTPFFLEKSSSHGKGINQKQAYFSAAFELFERLSARYYGTEEIIRATPRDVASYSIDLQKITSQVDNMNIVYDKFNQDRPVDWVWGKSLITGQEKLIPASNAFLTNAVFRGNFVPNGSSGLSAGAALKDAVLQGLFEVVEHDAWMICQANPICLPIIDDESIQNPSIRSIIEKIKELGFNICIRDYTTDIGIPTIRTWITDPFNYTKYGFNGFGCSIDANIALERSITEAVQGFIPDIPQEPYEYGRIHMVDAISSRDSLFGMYYFQKKDIEGKAIYKSITDLPSERVSSVDMALEVALKKLRNAMPDCDVLFVDLTRQEFGVPAVKVIVTGDIQRLSEPLVTVSKRLYEFPEKMAYTNKRFSYKELYLGPYQH